MDMQAIQQSIVQWLMTLEMTPGPEIRALIVQELERSPSQVTGAKYKAEVREIPSEDDEWESHEPTGRQWWTLTFADGKKFTFERDQEGVRIGRDPDDPAIG
jgi:hypothetical protein